MKPIDSKIYALSKVIDILNDEIEARKYLNRDYYEARGKLYGLRMGLSQMIDLKTIQEGYNEQTSNTES